MCMAMDMGIPSRDQCTTMRCSLMTEQEDRIPTGRERRMLATTVERPLTGRLFSMRHLLSLISFMGTRHAPTTNYVGGTSKLRPFIPSQAPDLFRRPTSIQSYGHKGMLPFPACQITYQLTSLLRMTFKRMEMSTSIRGDFIAQRLVRFRIRIKFDWRARVGIILICYLEPRQALIKLKQYFHSTIPLHA